MTAWLFGPVPVLRNADFTALLVPNYSSAPQRSEGSIKTRGQSKAVLGGVNPKAWVIPFPISNALQGQGSSPEIIQHLLDPSSRSCYIQKGHSRHHSAYCTPASSISNSSLRKAALINPGPHWRERSTRHVTCYNTPRQPTATPNLDRPSVRSSSSPHPTTAFGAALSSLAAPQGLQKQVRRLSRQNRVPQKYRCELVSASTATTDAALQCWIRHSSQRHL